MNTNSGQTIENVPEGSVGDVVQGMVDAGYTVVTATQQPGGTLWKVVAR